MAFGGENQSVGVSAHLHTNGAGDGGALDNTSTLDSNTLIKLMVALG